MSLDNELIKNEYQNEFIYDTIKFILINSNLSIVYKKVILREYINNYLNNNNEDKIKDIIKNYDIKIYDYLFLNPQEKNKKNVKEYYKNHKKELNEKRMNYYYEHRDQELQQKKEYYKKKKQEKIKEINEE